MKEYLTRKRKGFTLVELLIVIVVIGILSAMMMLSSSEAVSSAKATAIISDLRNLKTATLAFFADNADTYITGSWNADTPLSDEELNTVFTYLNGKDFPNKDCYNVIYKKDKTSWYAECRLDQLVKGTEYEAVKKKLAGRARSIGLYGNHAKALYDVAEEDAKNRVLMLIQ